MKNLTESLSRIVTNGTGKPYTNRDYENSRKASKEPSVNDNLNIDWLFDEFAETWDEQWTRKILGKVSEKKQKWSWAFAGKSREELQQALNKAIMNFSKPPEIADFNKLLPESIAMPEGWTHAKAGEIAEKKLKRLVPVKYAEVEMLQFIFRDLEKMIFETRKEHCDFAVCAVDNCYHYEIFGNPYFGAWRCIKHMSN